MFVSLDDDREVRFVLSDLDGLIEHRLVFEDSALLDTAGGGDDGLRGGVVDAHGQFVRGEAAEDDRVDRAEAGAGEHGHGRLGDHRHVDDDSIALGHALVGQSPREAGDLVEQFCVGDGTDGVGDRRVVDDGGLIAAAVRDMAVDRVVADVELAVGEPAIDRRIRIVDGLRRFGDPVDVVPGLLEPEPLGVLGDAGHDVVVAGCGVLGGVHDPIVTHGTVM